jgi:hypothetical protein
VTASTVILRSAFALSLLASSVAAQDRATVLWQPTAISYTIGEGASARSAEQASIPLAILLPFNRRFSMDITGAVAYTRVTEQDSTVSEIYGPTDTQIRANYQLLMDHLVLTLGVNAPSGQYEVNDEQQMAAGIIGNDFLFFPISSMGNGASGTAGAALAFELMSWNLGFGGSMRKSMEFTPYSSSSVDLRYQPADETRFRVTAERALWIGTASLGMTFIKFGEDVVDSTTYSTGDRVLSTAAWTIPIWRAQVGLGLWHLSREEGEQLGGPAPKEGIRNLSVALSVPLMKWTISPVLESRRWRMAGRPAGELQNLGVNLSIPVGANTFLEPRFTMSSGNLISPFDASETPITGWQGSLLIRRR